MKKLRVTLSLDDDVVKALEAMEARSLSAAANDVLRQSIAAEAHRKALLDWLDNLDRTHGRPTDAELASADEIIDDLTGELSRPAGAA